MVFFDWPRTHRSSMLFQVVSGLHSFSRMKHSPRCDHCICFTHAPAGAHEVSALGLSRVTPPGCPSSHTGFSSVWMCFHFCWVHTQEGNAGSQGAVHPHLTSAVRPETLSETTYNDTCFATGWLTYTSYIPLVSHLRSTFNLLKELLDCFPLWLPNFALPAAQKRAAVPGTSC